MALLLAYMGFVWLCMPSRLSPLTAFVAYVPLALGLRGLRPVSGLLWGWLMGACGWLVAVPWTVSGLREMLGYSLSGALAGTALLCLFQGLPYALLGLGCGLMRVRGREAGPVFCASLLTLAVVLSLIHI